MSIYQFLRRGLVCLVSSLALTSFTASDAQAAAQTLLIRVNSSDDNNLRDDVLTFREAILISEGKLKRSALTQKEFDQVKVQPSLFNNQFIYLLVDAKVGSDLPEITRNRTFIRNPAADAETNHRVIDGHKQVKVGLVVKALQFEILNVDLRNFTDRDLLIDETQAKPDENVSIRLLGVEFNDATMGLEFKGAPAQAIGGGRTHLELLKVEFHDVERGLKVSSSVGGDYTLKHAKFENPSLPITLAGDWEFGNGAGDINVTLEDVATTKARTGSKFAEHAQSGKINLTYKDAVFIDNDTAIQAQVEAEGKLDFTNGKYQGSTKADLKLKLRPVSSGAILIGMHGEAHTGGAKGVKLDWKGYAEVTAELLKFDDMGSSSFVVIGRANASGTLNESHSRYANVQIGPFWKVTPGFKLGAFYQYDLVRSRGEGFHFEDVVDPFSIENSQILSSESDGVNIQRSQGEIKSSRISSNHGRGIAIRDSKVEISGSVINNNHDNGIEVTDSEVNIYTSTILSNRKSGIAINTTQSAATSKSIIAQDLICFNRRDGVHVEGDSQVDATGNILDRNGPYDVRNLSPNQVPAENSDWGPITADEMNRKPYPSNISRIFDFFDDAAKGFVPYAGWANPGNGCTPRTSTPTSSPTASNTPTLTGTPTSSPTAETETPTPTATRSPTASTTPPSPVSPTNTGTPSSTPTITQTGISTGTSAPLALGTPEP